MNSISNSVGLEFTDTWKVWKNSLKKTINQLQCNYEELANCTCDIGRIRSNMGDIQVSYMFEDSPNQENQINITTIHGSKGMSLEAVLFFSLYQKPKKESGAYWKSWFETEEITEKNRLAYVSLSRAKHLLVLAIPKKKNSKDSDFKDLFNYGFEEYK